MATSLPTFSVEDPVASRIMDAFTGFQDKDGKPMTPVQTYRSWLKQELINRVTSVEAQRANADLGMQIT